MVLPNWFNNGQGNGGGGGDRNDRNMKELGADGPLTLMAIMAHPDDIDFGSAGSIAKWCAEGWTVYYVLATSGDKGTHGELSPQELAALREEEQREAGRVLGVKECIFLGYPDGFLDHSAELRGDVVRLLREYKPDVVLTWDAFRSEFNHVDHRNIGIAVRDAMYPAVRDHLYYPEYPGSVKVNELLLAGSDKPNYFVNVENFIETKADAMLAHASQIQTHDREKLLKDMRSRGRRRGGRGLVESFRRVRLGRPPQQAQEGEQPAEAQPSSAGAASSSS